MDCWVGVGRRGLLWHFWSEYIFYFVLSITGGGGGGEGGNDYI